MLNVTLIELRRELRAETGSSLNPAQGVQVQTTIDLILARQQRELWDAYNWQHLKTYADIALNDGQGVYSYPPELKFDQVSKMMIATGVRRDEVTGEIIAASAWQGLVYGIEPHMIPLGAPRTGTPVRWGNRVSINTTSADAITNPVGQFELLPRPPFYDPPRNDMVVRIAGQAPLSPLINDTDKCILDSTLIVLFAAAEVLANQKNEAAPLKLQKAQNYLRKLIADQGADKRDNYNMGGNQRGGIDPDKGRRAVPWIDYIPG